MTELLISEITCMGPGFCVIGLEHTGQSCRSIRPLPPVGHAWQAFPFRRGDRLRFSLSHIPVGAPHVEDRVLARILEKTGSVGEGDLVAHLRRAEVAENLSGLFHCAVHENPRGSGIYVEPNAADRSVCGCELQNVKFQVIPPKTVRAALLLPSGEPLRNLPLVDRDWNESIRRIFHETAGANQLHRINRFLNGFIAEKLLNDSNRFARIGLSRPFKGTHWLMLDSLFPLPWPSLFDRRP